jgi:Ca2+/H+ antiporter
VHHAEVIAHRVGEPFGSLVLAFAAVASVALYGLFLFVQTVRHRD